MSLRVLLRMKTQAHVYVSGRVQGVFFRSETRQLAQIQDVTGWVRNLADGRVEAVFEGEEENVKKLIDFCRKGSRWSKVAKVEVSWEQYTGKFSIFEII